ncbi:related to UTP6 - U3 snoRNP protein [Cephalotrichum gorgonifer]|uniref:Related to UTP6 - U3 snoRNP protein n=1 Tax=Cephalotrichum gorgonifer TaxID=2041049 RepID=A0AAE8MU38_9PEZI|nr:related to UTP6 - U3 snoRNP protein [Cephalotrichum gorgonifer]
MSGVAEKARFYLERSVPQLREWEEKEIFTKDELRNIVQKRNDFEHRVLSQGNSPADFSDYAKWEQSLDALRLKRCARLHLRNLSSAHASQGRVLQIYDRGVERYPFARDLWLEYLGYMNRVKASKRWRRVMTRALRFMPRDGGLWVMAARRSSTNGDMAGARSLFMRGCRFCVDEGTVWVEYVRCEMEWLQKMDAKKGGGAKAGSQEAARDDEDDEDEIRLGGSDSEDEDEDGVIARDPDAVGRGSSIKPKKVFSAETKTQLKHNPALDGAIPMAIFDISRKQPFFSAAVAERFFDVVAEFASSVRAAPKILQHILDAMQEAYPGSAEAGFCFVRQPVAGASPFTPEFPRGLREVYARLQPTVEASVEKDALRENLVVWVEGILKLEGLDEAIVTVLEHMKGLASAG